MSAPVTDDRQTAAAAFAAWAAVQPRAPRDAGALFNDVTVAHEPIGLLATDVEGRQLFWRSVPANGKARVTFPAIAIETIDAWNVEVVPLRERSNHIAICDACGGAAKVVCGACGGRATSMCPTCRGARKMYGYASNGSRRLLNCVTCKGKGELDCGDCRRGMADCQPCGGEGRVQRWIELETWKRSTAARHPDALAKRFGWDANPNDADVAADTDVVFDVERPRQLTAADLGSLPPQWLGALSSPLKPGERIVRQRLRIARFPTYSVAYRLGAREEHVDFAGRRLTPPPFDTPNGFTERARKLHALKLLLLSIFVVAALLSFGRGAFYRSTATSLSVAACAVTLAAIYGAASDWTATRRRVRGWLIAAGGALLISAAFAIAALPRVAHAQRLLAIGEIDEAASELEALGDRADANTWNELRLAQIRNAKDVDEARAAFMRIPADAPQHAKAVEELDRIILRSAASAADALLFEKAAESLALLSDAARGRPESVEAARNICLPLAKQNIARGEWRSAGDAIASARRLGVSDEDLEPIVASIRAAGVAEIRTAGRIENAEQRLRARLIAEAILMSWERAAGTFGGEDLIALRVAMAHDVAIVEKRKRRDS